MTNRQGAPEALTVVAPTKAQIIEGLRAVQSGIGPRRPAIYDQPDRNRWDYIDAACAALVEAQQPAQSAAAVDEGFLRSVIVLCNNQGASPESIENFDSGDKWIADLWRQAEQLIAPTPQADSQPAPVRGESAAPKLRAMAINYPEGACWDKLDAQTCMEGALEIEALRAARAPADSVTAPADDALRAQVVSLTRDCGRQASKIAELGADLKFQEEKHREDRARLQALYEHQRGECWYWQGDGQDHLESLCNTLPVVIRADQLRALVSTPPAQAADSVLEDAARLDHLQRTGSTVEVLPGVEFGDAWRYRVGGLHKAVSHDLRAAIDAARKQGANHD